jgi:hypothetical protein
VGEENMLCEAHKSRLSLHYCIDPERPEIKTLEELGKLRTVTSEEIEALSGWRVDGSGLYIEYPKDGTFVIRPDNPLPDGPKYCHPKGEPNSLFIPLGFDLDKVQDLWITEGELKALCGSLQGLLIVALGGVYSWRTTTEEASLLAEGERLRDEEALLPEIAQVSWEGKSITLLYDSDIVPGHKAYPAYERLAEQLYRLGAVEVRICSLPPLPEANGKTGLDDFIRIKGPEQALQDLQAMRDRKEAYIPIKAGGPAYAERLIKSSDPKDKLKAATAILGAEGEYFAGTWLKEKGLLQKDITPLLREAKAKLKALQAKPSVSSQGSQELGPEYDTPKALLKGSEDYSLDELGRLSKVLKKYNEKSGELEIRCLPICNFVAWPTRDIIKDNGLTTERFTEIEGILQGGASLKPAAISGRAFQEMKWPIENWGVRAAIKPQLEQEVRYAIQLMTQRGIPETKIYCHLGWRQMEDKWVYLHAGGAVGSDAVEVEITDKLQKYILPEDKGDVKKALRTSLSLLELGPKHILYPLYALIWLTPLTEVLRKAGAEPSFVTYLWGTTGSFKSTLIALLLSHYGHFEPKGLPANFRSTGKAIEEMAFQAKDTLLVVDDLYPAKNPKERTQMEGILEYIARNQGDRAGRDRLTSKIALMAGHPPRGLIVASGEVQPLSGSSLARNLVLHIQKEDINQERLSKAQAQKALLPHAMVGYLQWLAPQLDNLPSHLSEDFERLRTEATKESKTRTRHRRLDETVASLFLGLNIFFRYAVDEGAISENEAAKHLETAWTTFNEVADELAVIAEREEPTKRFFEALLELMALGRIYFATMEDVTPEIAERTIGAVKIGWGPDEKGVYYLLYGPAWEAVTRYLRTQEEGLSLSKSSLLDSMEQKGLLDRSQGDRRVIKKKIAGEQYRVLPLLEKAFKLEEGEDEA